eukprot:7875041-Pyramimonas_sp.AAC.1
MATTVSQEEPELTEAAAAAERFGGEAAAGSAADSSCLGVSGHPDSGHQLAVAPQCRRPQDASGSA